MLEESDNSPTFNVVLGAMYLQNLSFVIMDPCPSERNLPFTQLKLKILYLFLSCVSQSQIQSKMTNFRLINFPRLKEGCDLYK